MYTVGNHQSRHTVGVGQADIIISHHFVRSPKGRTGIDVGNVHRYHGVAGLEPCVGIFPFLESRLDRFDIVVRHYIQIALAAGEGDGRDEQ